jgi:hypothetical protein
VYDGVVCISNVEEAVRKQKDAGVDGVIVDHVLEIVKLEHQLEDQHSPISSSYSTTSSRTAILQGFWNVNGNLVSYSSSPAHSLSTPYL